MLISIHFSQNLGLVPVFYPVETKAPCNQPTMATVSWLCIFAQIYLFALPSIQLSASYHHGDVPICVLPSATFTHPQGSQETHEFKSFQTWLCLRTMGGSIKKKKYIQMVHKSHPRLNRSALISWSSSIRSEPTWLANISAILMA